MVYDVKYMGGKGALLRNGLGRTLCSLAPAHDRFVDLFAGSAAVSWYVAERVSVPLLSVDLQSYSAALALALIGRSKPVDAHELEKQWLDRADRSRRRGRNWSSSHLNLESLTSSQVADARRLCSNSEGGTIWRAYGGYYFSPRQSLSLDAMIDWLPRDEPIRSLCIAATIVGSSRCVAAPGHTAQPFQPTERALPHIAEFWSHDPLERGRTALRDLARRHARKRGAARVGDAEGTALDLRRGDLVFVDPPYSAVHYSRFYHVYETIATGWSGEVSGAGRYPPRQDRPTSSFSMKSESRRALDRLLERLAAGRTTVVLTFPAGDSSNGLSGKAVRDIAGRHFHVESETIEGRFSTLGGNGKNRAARHTSAELVLVLRSS